MVGGHSGPVWSFGERGSWTSHELLERCIGNDTEHLCLSCKKEFMVDSEAPITTCPKCKSSDIVDMMELGGKSCPYCKDGVFGADPGFSPIS